MFPLISTVKLARHSDPAAYLLTPDRWADQRVKFCQLVGKPADGQAALAAVATPVTRVVPNGWHPVSGAVQWDARSMFLVDDDEFVSDDEPPVDLERPRSWCWRCEIH